MLSLTPAMESELWKMTFKDRLFKSETFIGATLQIYNRIGSGTESFETSRILSIDHLFVV
jgi:hypothetical protein